MTFKKLSASFLLALLMLAGCGKKTEENKDDQAHQALVPSQDEINFNAIKELHRSVEDNDLAALIKVVQNHPHLDLNQLSHDGDTLLIKAIRNRNVPIRNFLLGKGVSVDKTSVNKETPLMAAVAAGDMNTVKVLLDLNADLGKKDNQGDCALHMAIKKKNEEIALLLIKHGASIDTTDRNDKNAYKLAQEHQTLQVLELIKSILQVEYGTPDVGSFRSVLTLGDVNSLNTMLTRFPRIAVDYETINPLVLALEIKTETTALKAVQLLLAYGANVNGPEDGDVTPLIRAVQLKRRAFVDILLAARANPNRIGTDGKSPLIHAIEQNALDMVKILLDYEAVKKYPYTKDGRSESYNACSVVKDVRKGLLTDEEKDISDEIKDELDCYFWSTWLL